MATTTITDLIRALETTKTMVLAVDQEDSSTGQIETKKIDLEQILNLFAVIGNEPPTGVAHIWSTDTIPTGYLELNGQTFDQNTYPQLGLIFPSGILPDWRGRVPKHTPTGQNAGTTEEDNIKAHNHVISVSQRDLGEKSSSIYNHNHNRGTMDIQGSFAGLSLGGNPSGAFGATTSTPGGITSGNDGFFVDYNFFANRNWSGLTSTDSHNHSITMGSHNHEATCSAVGGAENTVKGVFVRYIVRAR